MKTKQVISLNVAEFYRSRNPILLGFDRVRAVHVQRAAKVIDWRHLLVKWLVFSGAVALAGLVGCFTTGDPFYRTVALNRILGILLFGGGFAVMSILFALFVSYTRTYCTSEEEAVEDVLSLLPKDLQRFERWFGLKPLGIEHLFLVDGKINDRLVQVFRKGGQEALGLAVDAALPFTSQTPDNMYRYVHGRCSVK